MFNLHSELVSPKQFSSEGIKLSLQNWFARMS